MKAGMDGEKDWGMELQDKGKGKAGSGEHRTRGDRMHLLRKKGVADFEVIFFSIKVQLIYNVVLVTGVQQSDSVTPMCA